MDSRTQLQQLTLVFDCFSFIFHRLIMLMFHYINLKIENHIVKCS
jgi:hypothetical protein